MFKFECTIFHIIAVEVVCANNFQVGTYVSQSLFVDRRLYTFFLNNRV